MLGSIGLEDGRSNVTHCCKGTIMAYAVGSEMDLATTSGCHPGANSLVPALHLGTLGRVPVYLRVIVPSHCPPCARALLPLSTSTLRLSVNARCQWQLAPTRERSETSVRRKKLVGKDKMSFGRRVAKKGAQFSRDCPTKKSRVPGR